MTTDALDINPRRLALPSPRRTPLTAAYLGVLLASTVTLRVVGPARAEELLDALSTDAAHLTRVPVRVLLGSALVLPDLLWLPYAVVLGAALGLLERRAGWRAAASVFLSGHVVATLLTELPIAWAVHTSLLPDSAAHRLDVGVSYGMYAAIGACLGLLPRRLRLPGTLAAAVVVGVPLVLTHDMTTVGHVLSLGVGIAWWGRLTSLSREPARV